MIDISKYKAMKKFIMQKESNKINSDSYKRIRIRVKISRKNIMNRNNKMSKRRKKEKICITIDTKKLKRY